MIMYHPEISVSSCNYNVFHFLETFKCPFTGEEMRRMTLEGFQPGFEKTIQSGFESRTSNE